jgi:hypothetical protein
MNRINLYILLVLLITLILYVFFKNAGEKKGSELLFYPINHYVSKKRLEEIDSVKILIISSEPIKENLLDINKNIVYYYSSLKSGNPDFYLTYLKVSFTDSLNFKIYKNTYKLEPNRFYENLLFNFY